MEQEYAVSLITGAIWLIVNMVSILIVPSLIVGLIVAVFQAVTQINEQTLSFLPRLITTLLMIIFAGHWMLKAILEMFRSIFLSAPGVLG